MGTAAQGPSALIGQVIAGYQLERIVGTGATGAVFLGQPAGSAPGAAPAPTMATQVAIKILILPWQLDDGEREEFRARFLREANTLQRLRHPHILSVLAAGDDAGFTYMALPYMAGGTLAKRIASSPSLLPLTAAERYLSQLANALDYAHSEGIVHRDIKPANILLDEQEQVYLADFSIVRLLSETRTKLTTAGRVMGTPAYMAPEQVGTGTVGPATDIYSLGMVLYELTTGRVAFDATSLIDLIRQQVEAPPPPPRQARPDLPEPAAVAISKALAKRPQDRFASAGAFAWAFTAGLRGQWVEGLSPLVVEGSVGRGTTTVQQFTPQQTALSSPPYSSYPRPHQGTSRRAVVLGLLGLSAVGAGVMWFARSERVWHMRRIPLIKETG